MGLDSILALLAVLIFGALYLFATLGEYGLISARRSGGIRPDESGSTRIPFASELYANPRRATEGLRFLQVLFSAGLLVSGVSLAVSVVGSTWIWVFTSSLGAIVLLVISRTVVQRIALQHTGKFLYPLMVVSHLVNRFLQPWRDLEAVVSRAPKRRSGNGDLSSKNEPRIEITVESEDGPLGEREEQMIRAVVRQDKTSAREIMVPREDIVAVDIQTSLTAVAQAMFDSGHSRLPVYEGNLDQVKGLIYARDVLRVVNKDNNNKVETPLAKILRKALFIPESKNLEELLEEFQGSRVHMALVVDEHGGVAGLVTIEDLLEEIVGEIQDEFDAAEPEFHRVSDQEFLVDARINLDKLSQLTGVDVALEGIDSLGGLVYHDLGRIAVVGDSVEIKGLQVTVVSTIGRRLKRLRVHLLESSAL